MKTEAQKRASNKWRKKPKPKAKEQLDWRIWVANNLERRRRQARESARRRRALKKL